MRHARALALMLVPLLGACDGDDVTGPDPDPSGSIRLSASLPAGARSLGPGSRGPLGLPGYGDGSGIDQAVAVAHDHGTVWFEETPPIVAPVEPGGSFSFDLATNRDWVVLLVNSMAEPEERVRAYVTIGDVEASLVNIPVTKARTNVDLGELDAEGDEAQSETTVAQASESFTLSPSTMAEMARVDDAFRSVVNAYLNWHDDGQVAYSITPSVIWSDPLGRLMDGTSTPQGYTFLGYGLTLRTNDPRIDVEAICNGSKVLRIVPPADVRVATGETLGADSPVQFAGPPEMHQEAMACGDQHFMSVGRWGDGGIADITVPATNYLHLTNAHFVDIVEGWWHLELDGEVLATFDLNLASPVDAALHPTGAVPAGQLAIDGSGLLTSLGIDWLRWDEPAAAFAPLELEPLQQLFYATKTTFWGWKGQVGEEAKDEHSAPYDDRVQTSVSPSEESWFTGNLAEQPEGTAILNAVEVSWAAGGIEHRVTWYGQPCHDLDDDGQSYCYGDADDKLPEESFCLIRNASGAPIVAGDTTYEQLAANYYGSFLMYGNCFWAPAPRPHARVVYELSTSTGELLASFERDPYQWLYEEYTYAGAGDYTLTATAYDALGNAQDAITLPIRVRPFTDFFDEPTVSAELTSGGSVLHVNSNYIFGYLDSCLPVLTDASLTLLAADGCDTALAGDANCGGCGLACGGSETCRTVGFCYDDAGTCTTPMKDCDANAGTGVNGCETDVSADRLHCGACDRVCAAGFDCLLGVCRPRCGPAVGDCDDDPGTGEGGCETDLLANDESCGACGQACTGAAACFDGICWDASDPCATGTADCDGLPTTGDGGCEASLYDDDANCGACDHACGTQERCRGGSCHPRCPRLAGDCSSPSTGAWLTVECAPAGVGMGYDYSWGVGDAPVAVGDRIELRPDFLPWECSGNFLGVVPGVHGAEIPCPGFFPPLTMRVSGP